MIKRALRATCVGFAAAVAIAAAPVADAATVLPNPRQDLIAPTLPAGTSVSGATNWLENALSMRTNQLNKLQNAISKSQTLTDDNTTALTGIVSDTSDGIASLANKVANDSTLAALRSDAATMVNSYHVYSIVSPQVRTVITIDGQLSDLTGLTKLEPGIATAIATAQKSAGASQEAKDQQDFLSQLASVTSDLNGLPDSVVALSPDGDNGDPTAARLVLQSATTSSASARAHLANAESDLHDILQLLSS